MIEINRMHIPFFLLVWTSLLFTIRTTRTMRHLFTRSLQGTCEVDIPASRMMLRHHFRLKPSGSPEDVKKAGAGSELAHLKQILREDKKKEAISSSSPSA